MDKQKFIDKFSLQEHGLSIPVAFSDAFGFSTSKERQQNGLTFVSIYKFYFKEEDLKNDKTKKPIIISVSYAEKLKDETLRLSPTSIKRRINWPIDLLSTDEFFYDHKSEKFYFKDKEITPEDIVKKIEFLHTKPTKLLQGSILIVKLFFWGVLVTNLFKSLYYLLIKILYIIAGTKTERSIWLVNIIRDRPEADKKVTKESFAEDKINIFGYQASAWSVVVYAILHLGVYSLWYFYLDIESDFVQSIFSNGFLTIMYVIPSLVFFERLVPKLIEFFIRKSGLYFHNTSFKQIKI
ncbi:MAG: hypothetical protein NUV53_02990 [Patescibacteria group bacterium]|nr:hypothetical protein [Patescibacteria group bacterium]